MEMTLDQIKATVAYLKEHEVKPITLTTRKMVRLANQASPFGHRFYMLQKVYRVDTKDGSFVVAV